MDEIEILTLEEANEIVGEHFAQVRGEIKRSGSTPFLNAIATLQKIANQK